MRLQLVQRRMVWDRLDDLLLLVLVLLLLLHLALSVCLSVCLSVRKKLFLLNSLLVLYSGLGSSIEKLKIEVDKRSIISPLVCITLWFLNFS